MNKEKEYSPKRFAIASVSCPSCHMKLEREASWCGACGFTGQKSIDMFGDDPPPLLPILDVADLWSEKEQKSITSAVKKFNKRFPQVNWRICAVSLEPEVNLSVFGFWLMNVCPLELGETEEDREWTILLLVDGKSCSATVTPGYRAELWLSDEMWDRILAESVSLLVSGQPVEAVSVFLNRTRKLMDDAWERTRRQLQPRQSK